MHGKNLLQSCFHCGPEWKKKTFIFYTFILYYFYPVVCTTYVDNSLCSGKTCGVSFEKNYRCSSSIPEKA